MSRYDTVYGRVYLDDDYEPRKEDDCMDSLQAESINSISYINPHGKENIEIEDYPAVHYVYGYGEYTESDYFFDYYVNVEENSPEYSLYKGLMSERLSELVGNYIIEGVSKFDSNVPMYLQDMKYVIKGGRNWTKFKSNAKVFDDKRYAEQVARKFPNMKAKVVKL